jgi:hypothetical protein
LLLWFNSYYKLLDTARGENAILQQRVKELTARVKVLTVANAALEAEVEMYRNDATSASSVALPSVAGLTLGSTSDATAASAKDADEFLFKSGDGVYCTESDTVHANLHGSANPLVVDVWNETILVTGGADSTVRFTNAFSSSSSEENTMSDGAAACSVSLPAPVIAAAVAPSTVKQTVAAGCMDGSVHLIEFETSTPLRALIVPTESLKKHSKYVRAVVWDNTNKLVTASADGTMHLYQVVRNILMETVEITCVKSFHFDAAIESVCFHGPVLLAYIRGTAHLTTIDTSNNDYDITKINLNVNTRNAVTGGFDDHVSFAILDMKISPNGKFLAAATDTSRHIIMDLTNHNVQIRNLYGHKADIYSSPVLAWSANSLYLYSNNQDASEYVVYEISSASIVSTISEHHVRPIKSMWSSRNSNMLVTNSFDRNTVVWIAKRADE